MDLVTSREPEHITKLAYIGKRIMIFDARSNTRENAYDEKSFICIGKGSVRQVGDHVYEKGEMKEEYFFQKITKDIKKSFPEDMLISQLRSLTFSEHNLKCCSEAADFNVECEVCKKPLNSKTVKIGMGKKEAYSFKCAQCSDLDIKNKDQYSKKTTDTLQEKNKMQNNLKKKHIRTATFYTIVFAIIILSIEVMFGLYLIPDTPPPPMTVKKALLLSVLVLVNFFGVSLVLGTWYYSLLDSLSNKSKKIQQI